MSKALIGSIADHRTIALLDEVRALRSRVRDLEAALAEAEAEAREAEQRTDPAIVLEPSNA